MSVHIGFEAKHIKLIEQLFTLQKKGMHAADRVEGEKSWGQGSNNS